MTDPNQTQAAQVPLPGTPEYEELYQAALKQLEEAETAPPETPPAETPPAATPPATPPGETPPAETPPTPVEFSPEAQKTIDTLKADLEQQGKRLRDTQQWTHGIVTRLRDFYKQVRQAQSQGERPKALEDIDGLEEAIQHVVKGTIGPEDDLFPELADTDGTPNALDYTDDQWTGIVATALPDMDELLADEGLMAQVEQVRTEMGDDWKNPLLAINALAELRADHLHKQNVNEAVKAALAQMAKTNERASAMQVPGGAAGSGAPPPAGGSKEGASDPVQDAGYWDPKNMTDEKFEQERNRVLTQ